MKVYYAHCMSLYDTPQATRDITMLQSLGFAVVDPGSDEYTAAFEQLKTSDERMAYCERWADECDAIAFRALPDGSLPAGVAKEIYWFQERQKPVFELPHFALRKVLDVNETRLYLKEVGER